MEVRRPRMTPNPKTQAGMRAVVRVATPSLKEGRFGESNGESRPHKPKRRAGVHRATNLRVDLCEDSAAIACWLTANAPSSGGFGKVQPVGGHLAMVLATFCMPAISGTA